MLYDGERLKPGPFAPHHDRLAGPRLIRAVDGRCNQDIACLGFDLGHVEPEHIADLAHIGVVEGCGHAAVEPRPAAGLVPCVTDLSFDHDKRGVLRAGLLRWRQHLLAEVLFDQFKLVRLDGALPVHDVGDAGSGKADLPGYPRLVEMRLSSQDLLDPLDMLRGHGGLPYAYRSRTLIHFGLHVHELYPPFITIRHQAEPLISSECSNGRRSHLDIALRKRQHNVPVPRAESAYGHSAERASQPVARCRPLDSTTLPGLAGAVSAAPAFRGPNEELFVILGHTIALDPTAAQSAAFRRACGVARYAFNWGLNRWQEMHAAGLKPTAMKVKAEWNAHRKSLPWTFEVTKCASAAAITDLGAAFANFFRDAKKPKSQRRSRFPRFKSRRSDNGFALFNDQFHVDGDRIRIPKVGWVRMREKIRFAGKIMGARVSRIGTRWHVSIQVETSPAVMDTPDGVVGVDLGITHLMTLSKPLPDGRIKITNPRAGRRMLGRQRKLARRISRQELQRRKTNGKTSRRQMVLRDRLRRLHRRIASIRKDSLHKATTAIAKAFRVVCLEDLNVAGMSKNKHLAGSILDASFREIRRQLDYKTAMRGGRVVVVDRWFPSSKACSLCGVIADSMPLHRRDWNCASCGAHHDRDENAANNLELVGATCPEPAGHYAQSTRGETGALVVEQSTTKLWSVNRELGTTQIERSVCSGK